MNRVVTFAVTAALATFAARSNAQSRYSQSLIAAGNYTSTNNSLYILDFEDSSVGSPVSAAATRSWSGLNGAENPAVQEMTLSATASASSAYGRLRTSVDGTIQNSFYNSENAAYYDGTGDPNEEGSPSSFAIASYAGFTDVLSFGGGAQAGYKAKYTFFIHGNASGSSIYSYLDCNIAGNLEEHTVDLSGGNVGYYWTTDAYEISALRNQEVKVDFSTQFLPSTFVYTDGSTITGRLDFSSTISLAAVQLFDTSGNRVSNYTVTGASGTAYPVPEPASMAALGLGAAAMLRRRRQVKA